MAVQILLKALANLPRTDFVLLKSVLPLNLVSLSVVSQVPSPREGGPIGFRSFITSVFTGQINLYCYVATYSQVSGIETLVSWLCYHGYQLCTILFNCLETSSEILFNCLVTTTTATCCYMCRKAMLLAAGDGAMLLAAGDRAMLHK